MTICMCKDKIYVRLLNYNALDFLVKFNHVVALTNATQIALCFHKTN